MEKNVPFYIGATENDLLLGLDTHSVKKDGDLCVICYYDSDDEEEQNSETDVELSKETIHNTNRYCYLSYFDKDGVADHICAHTFHTLCMYKWIKSCKKLECPMCKRGHDEVIENIPALIPKGPEYVVEYHRNGEKKVEYYKINDKRNGLYKEYDRFGNLKIQCDYDNDQKHGMELLFFRGTMVVKESRNYAHGKKHGEFKQFSLRKKVLKYAVYQQDILQGPYREFKELQNGLCVKIKETNYQNGKKQGMFCIWNDSGDLLKRCEYTNGKKVNRYIKRFNEKSLGIAVKKNYDQWGYLHGICQRYHKNGNLKEKSFYHRGVMVKRHFVFFSNGNNDIYEEYNNLGQLDGIKREWYRNGKRKIYYRYDDGKLDGVCIRFNEQGKAIEICNYKNDLADGTYTLNYYDGATVKSTKEFKSGLQHGLSRDYDKNGCLLYESLFKDGLLHGKAVDYTQNIEYHYENGEMMCM